MTKSIALILYLFALAANICGAAFSWPLAEQISKPSLMPLLGLLFLLETRGQSSALKTWIITALFFSWAGDILLMFQEKNELYFLLGLSAFLLAHVSYIIFFHRIRMLEKLGSKGWLVLPVAVYYATLIIWLSPYLGDKKIPVRVYGLVISIMLLLALHLMNSLNKKAARLMVAGALLFVMSDSLLAINKFYHPFPGAGVIIMLTYGLAQLWISQGAARYIRESNSV